MSLEVVVTVAIADEFVVELDDKYDAKEVITWISSLHSTDSTFPAVCVTSQDFWLLLVDVVIKKVN